MDESQSYVTKTSAMTSSIQQVLTVFISETSHEINLYLLERKANPRIHLICVAGNQNQVLILLGIPSVEPNKE